MKSYKDIIGFNDKWLLLFGIPISALLISLLLFSEELSGMPLNTFLSRCLLVSIIYTTVFWLSFREILVFMRRRFPNHKNVRKRLIYQSIFMLIFYLILKNILRVVIDEWLLGPVVYYSSPLVMNISALIVVTTIVAIYESNYFYNQLNKTIVEAEQLKRENIQSQLEGLKNQVNPHFLFNSLNTLIHIIPENPDLGVRFVQKLSKVYRYILEIRDKKLIRLEEELDFIHSYIFLLKERFGENLKVDIRIPEAFRKEKIVPLSLQILFENAIKHNIISAQKPLKIEVYIEENNRLIVRNNLQKKNQVMNSTKVGLQNIKNRYKFFSDEQVQVIATADSFIVVLPLIKMKDLVEV